MHDSLRAPDYAGGSLVDLAVEIEARLVGRSATPGLYDHLADVVPDKATYVLVLADGLGDHQLDHPAAGALRQARRAAIDTVFPTTTNVALAALAGGRPPGLTGMIGHHMWLPELGHTVNALKWIVPGTGTPVDFDTTTLLPSPNLWERLRAAGVEPITVQPGNFAGSPLTHAVYRGCRFEGAWTPEEIVDATVELADTPGRLILTYLPQIDLAAHVFGQDSTHYGEAVGLVAAVWERIASRLPAHACLVGTSDHGHLDYRPDGKFLLTSGDLRDLTVSGDPRSLYVAGPARRIAELAERVPGRWVGADRLVELLGGELSHARGRLPDGVILADPGRLLLPGWMDRRLVGYHGGLLPEELRVPLLVA